MTQNYIGVDLAKDKLDVHDPGTGREFQISNTGAAVRRFVARLTARDFLVFEATSGCDTVLLRELRAGARAYARLNPLHAWHFSQSCNLAKTDRVDARMLSRFGRERRPAAQAGRDRAREELGEISQRRDQLRRMETQEKNRLSRDPEPWIARDIRAVLRSLAHRIARFDQAIAAHIAKHAALSRSAALLRSVPGIGPVTAAALLAQLPELGTLDRRAVASLGGLAPKARESGKYKGKRHIGKGRRHVRKALYMAALSLWRSRGVFRPFIARLQAAGKPGKLILIALARKLLTIANAVLRDNQPFRKTPLGAA